MRNTLLLVASCAVVGCTGLVSPMPDGGFDEEDGGGDAAVEFDAGAGLDAGHDAGVMDAGLPDAGLPDAGVTPDAGVVDAGVVDAGVADGGVSCPADALLCESFENGLQGSRWRINGNAAALTIDESTTAIDGRRSLHLRYGTPFANTGEQAVELLTPPTTPDDRLYLRVWLRFADLSLPGAHPSFVDVTDGRNEVGFGSIINDWAMMGWGFYGGGLDDARIWYEGGGWHPGVEDGDATPNTEQSLRAREWFCFEAMYFGDHQGASDTSHPGEQVTVWIDGVEIPQLDLSDALWTASRGSAPPEHWSPVYDRARWRFGLESFGPANVGLEIWFDALAFSHSRLGCR
ncbi:MAG: hypothetical protein ACOZQL_03945 [Myxococcota bacterium]